MGDTQLPFGQTATTTAELAGAIDVSTAANELDSRGVSAPERRLEVFLDELPALFDWLATHGRDYPWRRTTDPWRVYICEILLQRTRGNAVAEVYDDFFSKFPTPRALYQADDSQIYTIISPLGFGEQRTRTLQEIAELCYIEHSGQVPRDLDELVRPWRVGPYSARACLLFAFGEPLGLVDANIERVIERIFDYEMPSQPHKSDDVYALMDALVPATTGLARAFTLSLLDLGAQICTSATPRCPYCPLNTACVYATSRD